MFPKKFVIDITKLGFSKEFIYNIYDNWLPDDVAVFSYRNTFISGYYDVYEYDEVNKEYKINQGYLKVFLEKLVEIGIDLESEEYIILTIGEYTAEQIREGRF